MTEARVRVLDGDAILQERFISEDSVDPLVLRPFPTHEEFIIQHGPKAIDPVTFRRSRRNSRIQKVEAGKTKRFVPKEDDHYRDNQRIIQIEHLSEPEYEDIE